MCRQGRQDAHGVCRPDRDTAAKRQKVLILLVGSCCSGGLIRGLENLDVPGKGNGFILFACTKRMGSTPEVCEPLDSGDNSKLCRRRFQQSFPTTRVEPGFSQNGGEKALNRCDAPALQRKELER